MAMVKCPKCGNEISDETKTCSNCGAVLIEKPAIEETGDDEELTDGGTIDYEKKYKAYKQLPIILMFLSFSICCIVGIVLVVITTDALHVIFLPIGVVVGGLTYFISSICIAPTVLRTDAVLDIKRKLEEKIQKEESDKK